MGKFESVMDTENAPVSVSFGAPVVVLLAPPGEMRWGYYQFPKLSRIGKGRLAVSYHVAPDCTSSYGTHQPTRVSDDDGQSWRDARPGEIEATTAGAIVFPDGEALRIPRRTPLAAGTLKLPTKHVTHTDQFGRRSECYRLGDLPVRLQGMKTLRRDPGKREWRAETARLDVPGLVVLRYRWDSSAAGWKDPDHLVQPHLDTEFFQVNTPDNGLLLFCHAALFNPDGTLPERKAMCVFRTDDRGRSWRLWGVPGWFRDEDKQIAATKPFLDDPDSNYNRLWGGRDRAPVPNTRVDGLFEPGVAAFGGGRMVCVMRTSSGGTHEPTYASRSTDWGRTWTVPEILTPFGVMPKLVRLDNGIVAMVYGRPGVQLLFCSDGRGENWHTPVNFLPDPGEATRASAGVRGGARKTDTCANCTVLKTGPDRFLVAYSDFRHDRAPGYRIKAICVREVRVTAQIGPRG